jgi:hypothetical protein
MKQSLVVALVILSWGSLHRTVLAQDRPFTISFEMNGQRVETNLTVRIKQGDQLTEIKYVPNSPIRFPVLEPGKRFDIWIITDTYRLPFLDMHPDALTVAGWRVGIDVRPFDLDYLELKLLSRRVKLVYYMIYQHADGGITPIWFESREPLKDLRIDNATP